MKRFIKVLLTSLVLCYYAFYNKYPLVYSDTGTYIASGFKNFFPDDRPVFYGWFLRHVSLHSSLFLVVFVQGLLLSSLIFLLFKNFSITTRPALWTLIAGIILTITTGISFNVSQLLPDIFAPFSIICLLLLLFGKKLSRFQTILLSILYIFSNISHYSNVFSNTLLIGFISLILIIKRKNSLLIIDHNRILLSFALLLSCYFIVPFTHYLYDKKFVFSNGSHVFRVQKLIEYGILEEFLKDECSKNHYTLCDYQGKAELLWNFMWDPKSPSYLNGGWAAHEQEYNQIFLNALSEKKYRKIYIRKSIESFFIGFFSFETGDAAKADAEGAPFNAIQQWFPADIQLYYGTRQIREQLDFKFLNQMQLYIVFFSIIFIALFFSISFFRFSNYQILKSSIFLILGYLIFNALICSNLTTLAARMQSRIIWLIPLFTLIIVSDLIKRFEILDLIKNKWKHTRN